MDPGEEVSEACVDAVLPLGGALLSPADHAQQEAGTAVRDYKWATTVSAAGVHVGLLVPGAEHVVCDHLQSTKPLITL